MRQYIKPAIRIKTFTPTSLLEGTVNKITSPEGDEIDSSGDNKPVEEDEYVDEGMARPYWDPEAWGSCW